MRKYKVTFDTEFIIPYEGEVTVLAKDSQEAIYNALDKVLDNLTIEDVENIGLPEVEEL